MVYSRNISGAVLIPVLLLAGMMALGVIILLQTQITQNKSITDFKQYLHNKREQEKYYAYLNDLPIKKLERLENIQLKQQLPQNLHYQNNYDDYYFQVNPNQYIYKSTAFSQYLSFSEQAFDYADMILVSIQIKKGEEFLFYLYDKKSEKIFFQYLFKHLFTFQLVGNPVDSIYFHDNKNLYKLELNFIESATLKVLKNMENGVEKSEAFSELLVTRDARGDGRLIYLIQNNKRPTLIFHEASLMQHEYLDLFEHY